MGFPTRFIPHAVELLTGPIWINQIEEMAPEVGVELFEESAGSEIDTEFVSIKAVQSVMPFATSDLTALGTIGFSGLSLTSTGQILAAYGRELPLGAVPTALATTNHLKLTCTDGLLVPMGVSASHNTVAKLSLMLHGYLGTGGGANATPFVFSKANAIPSGAAQVANVYTLGPVKYTISGGASRLVAGMQQSGVQFGLNVHKEGSDSNIDLSHVSIIGRAARCEFGTKDAGLIAEIGKGVAVSSFACYFQQVAANGVDRVPAGTASHVSVTGTAGVLKPGALTLRHKSSGESTFTFVPAKNTTLLTISTTATIPTT